MKILLFHNVLWSHYKAAVFTELAKLCLTEGYDFKVVHVAETESMRKGMSGADQRLHGYPYEVLFNGEFEKTNLFSRFCGAYQKFKEFKPSILMINQYSDISLLFLCYLAKIGGVRIVMAADATPFDSRRRFFKEFLKSLLLKPFEIVFCYGTMSEKYLTSLGVSPRKIKIRCQATQNDEIRRIFLSSNKSRKVLVADRNFIYVGRFSKEKNLHTLLEAFSKIKNESWGLILVGSGSQEKELKDFAVTRGIKNVFWAGAKNWREVVPFYSLADVLVLPSLSEPWGLVVNEAMLCELPVIVSNHCGSSADLVQEGVNGYTFNPGSESELIVLMNKFVNQEVSAEHMGKRSLELIKPYSPKKSAEQIFIEFKILVGSNASTI